MLDELKQSGREPSFVRGDCAWGTDRAMQGAEERSIAYLFKLKQTANVKKLIQDVRQGQLGGRRPELGGSGYGTAVERLEEEAAGGAVAAAAAGYRGAGETRQTK